MHVHVDQPQNYEMVLFLICCEFQEVHGPSINIKRCSIAYIHCIPVPKPGLSLGLIKRHYDSLNEDEGMVQGSNKINNADS